MSNHSPSHNAMPGPTTAAPAGPRIDLTAYRRIAVFRALQLGDLLCAVPALRALRNACPQAEISLIGLPWTASWCARLPYINRWFEFPGWPGLPERAVDHRALPTFIALMQSCHHDLVLQMHGSGGLTNPLLETFQAGEYAGFHRADDWHPEGWLAVPWPQQGHEIERCLALTDSLGAPRRGIALEFPVLAADRAAVAARWPALREHDYVCLHAGSQLPSRRWPVQRFAGVAAVLLRAGLHVVLTGTAGERPLADALRANLTDLLAGDVGLRAQDRLTDLVGATSLWQLGAVLEGARLLICNDTGVSHIAAALQVPSVVVSCGADPARWAPLDQRRHRVLAHPAECRPCGWRECPTGHACALGTGVEEVASAALAQLHAYDAERRHRGGAVNGVQPAEKRHGAPA
jgi:ADP-heptose:LPS heptosyltransferase